MDSLIDILGKKDFDEPSEIASIKKIISDNYGITPNLSVKGESIIISLPNASLVSTLRLKGPEIKRRCQTEKKLIFRIS